MKAALKLWCKLAVCGVLLINVSASWSAPGGLPINTADDDTSPEWLRIRSHLFQQRSIHDHQSLVQMEMPRRAAFGAAVPVSIKSKVLQSNESYVKKIYLVIDKNPSPLAAVYEFTPDSGLAEMETRIRVQEYSHVRVIAEMSDGQLHMDSKYAKVSGGCTQPPNRDQAKHRAELGTMKFRLLDKPVAGQTHPVQLNIRHPNNTGMELDQITVMYIPPHYVSRLAVTYSGKPILSAVMDFSISEDPYLRFNFVPGDSGELKAEIEDSKEMKFSHAMPVEVGGL